MYSYIKGIITKITPKYIVLENNNIGYKIVVSNPYNYNISDEIVCMYIYHYLREEQEILYGFKNEDEKELFLKLISVSGIGPKSALSILASSSVYEIVEAINNNDALFLKKFPGIGTKASQQIILDLNGKINLSDSISLDNNQKANDISLALITLGYAKKEVSKVVSNLDLTKDDSTLIRESLKELNK